MLFIIRFLEASPDVHARGVGLLGESPLLAKSGIALLLY